ncbi:GntR family transcriptional regulator [Domibacillus antri]|nr:GntR family transcriptional regulator [Domibacillus antri]
MNQLKRVDPLYEQIYKNVEQSIVEGRFAPGERLIDTKIASEFGVSRGPVREAFRKLEQDGLILNNDGIVTVFTPSLQDALELYQVRIGLESVAAYWAARHIDDEKLEQLKQFLDLTQAAINAKKMDEVVYLNTQFHESIVTFSGNNRLKVMMYNIRTLIQLCRNTIIKQYNRSDSFLSEHYAVFEAIQSRNPELAAERMEQHIQNDMEAF